MGTIHTSEARRGWAGLRPVWLAALLGLSIAMGPVGARAAQDAGGANGTGAEQPGDTEQTGEASESETDDTKKNGEKRDQKENQKQKEKDEEQDKLAKAFGESKDFEFSQKYFSLMTGAVVLNPLVLEPDDAGDYFLTTGQTNTSFVLELGFRRRWAWLDRYPPNTAALQKKVQREIDKLDALEAQVKLTGAAGLSDEQEAARAELKQRIQVLKAVDAEPADEPGAAALVRTDRFFGPIDMVKADGAWVLWPDDFTVRLGFAFGSETPTGAASLAGSSDLYADMALGWNVVRFTPSSVVDTEVPIRGAFNIEGYGTVNTDKSQADVHGRGLFGGAFVFGIPYSLKSPVEGASPQIVELVVRVGAAWVEIPQFVDDTTLQIETKNGLPSFESEWGGGADIEFNVPIPNQLGYLTARGTFNMGFDPNPWTLMVGYSVPFDKVWGAVSK